MSEEGGVVLLAAPRWPRRTEVGSVAWFSKPGSHAPAQTIADRGCGGNPSLSLFVLDSVDLVTGDEQLPVEGDSPATRPSAQQRVRWHAVIPSASAATLLGIISAPPSTDPTLSGTATSFSTDEGTGTGHANSQELHAGVPSHQFSVVAVTVDRRIAAP